MLICPFVPSPVVTALEITMPAIVSVIAAANGIEEPAGHTVA
jgi:hypothetical protein